jgi:hypothetical protein
MQAPTDKQLLYDSPVSHWAYGEQSLGHTKMVVLVHSILRFVEYLFGLIVPIVWMMLDSSAEFPVSISETEGESEKKKEREEHQHVHPHPRIKRLSRHSRAKYVGEVVVRAPDSHLHPPHCLSVPCTHHRHQHHYHSAPSSSSLYHHTHLRLHTSSKNAVRMPVAHFGMMAGWMEPTPYAGGMPAPWRVGHRSVGLGWRGRKVGVGVAMDVCFHVHVNSNSNHGDWLEESNLNLHWDL